MIDYVIYILCVPLSPRGHLTSRYLVDLLRKGLLLHIDVGFFLELPKFVSTHFTLCAVASILYDKLKTLCVYINTHQIYSAKLLER